VKGNILVIEDDEGIREALVDIFHDHGFRATGAVHGRDGLDKLQRDQLVPCLIILDLMMPVMDGAEFSDVIRHIPALAQVPVVVITAYSDFARAGDVDAVAYLKKPIQVDDLLAVAAAHCRSI
jgi:two-component system, chemotaxis family, chemotaxis protein CheY